MVLIRPLRCAMAALPEATDAGSLAYGQKRKPATSCAVQLVDLDRCREGRENGRNWPDSDLPLALTKVGS